MSETHSAERDALTEVIATHTPDRVALAADGISEGEHWYCVACGVLPPTIQNGAEHVAEQVLVACAIPPGRGNMTAEKDATDYLARLRDEVVAVVAEHFWDGDADRSQPDYDTIARLWDDAASNVIPPARTDA